MDSEEGQTYAPWFRKHLLEGGGVSADLAAKLVTRLAAGEADSLSGRFIRVCDDFDKLILHSAQIQQDDLYTLRLRNLVS